MGTPGPGSYENPISATNSRGNNKRPSSAFSSRSKRLDPDEKHAGDPLTPLASLRKSPAAPSATHPEKVSALSLFRGVISVIVEGPGTRFVAFEHACDSGCNIR